MAYGLSLKSRLGFLMGLGVLVLVTVFATPARAGEWTTMTVDAEGPSGIYNAIAVDSQNNYLISYSDGIDDDLQFAKSTDKGATWVMTVVDSNGGKHCSISVDPSDNSYLISYYGANDLRFAKSIDGGVSWDVVLVGENIKQGRETKLAVDRLGNYVILFFDNFTGILRIAKSVDGGETWTSSVIEDVTFVADYYKDLAIDPENNYLVVYSDFQIGMRFAKSVDGGSSWTKSTVEPGVMSFIGAYIAVDTDDNFVTVYSNRVEATTSISTSSDGGANWSDPVDIQLGVDPYYPCFVIGEDGTFVVAYEAFDGAVFSLAVMTSIDQGESWIEESVDTGTEVQHSLSIEMNGDPVLSYSKDSTLMFARYISDTQAPTLPTPVLTPGPTTATPIITGTVTEDLNTVTSVEFQMDCPDGVCDASGWTVCTAEDGVFDEAEEAYICQVTEPLSPGPHTIYIRATDSYGNTTLSGSEVSVAFEVAAAPVVEDPEEEPASEDEETEEPAAELAETGETLVLFQLIYVIVVIIYFSMSRFFRDPRSV
ncbi:MAG: sialidase family protein [Candidatus Dojkabacteria bacterium]|nr:sialidase family protein [Candidatus Dojkabacteria bacterium]